jgi:hypothetical protein
MEREAPPTQGNRKFFIALASQSRAAGCTGAIAASIAGPLLALPTNKQTTTGVA